MKSKFALLNSVPAELEIDPSSIIPELKACHLLAGSIKGHLIYPTHYGIMNNTA